MKRFSRNVLLALSSAAGLLGSPHASIAQVWGIGPDGKMGYVTTRLPSSPNCTPPQVWTLTNGHYSCQTPIPPAPTCPVGYTQDSPPVWNGSSWVGLSCSVPPPPPSSVDPRAACAAAVPGGYTQPASFGADSSLNLPLDNYNAQQSGIAGYSSIWSGSSTVLGPSYSNACGTANTYRAVCYTRPDNSVVGLFFVPTGGTSSGQCNH